MNIQNYKPNSELTKEILEENNFRYIDGLYSYRFPVYKYKKEPTLWCTLFLDTENNSCGLNVSDQNNNTYAPFFNRTYSSGNKVIASVDRIIQITLSALVKDKILKKRGTK